MDDKPILSPAGFEEAIDVLKQRVSEITEFQRSLSILLDSLEECRKVSNSTEASPADRSTHDSQYWQGRLLDNLDTTSQLESLNQKWAEHHTDDTLTQLRQMIGEADPNTHPSRPSGELWEDTSSCTAPTEPTTPPNDVPPSRRKRKWPLEHHEYTRYSRQLIMPEVGLQGQLGLKAAKVLIIGAGGLGCPAAAYLAGAGVGTLGIADGDTVEVSNLHRQILHSMDTVGMLKTESAILRLKATNPHVEYVAHSEAVTPTNVLGMVEKYDLVLDCTDMPSTRYLISDACIIAGKPLVSASALRTSGQLTVFNYPPAPAGAIEADGSPKGGPCYRCVWPKPPPAEAVQSCGEGGILGPVVGVMGVLMATEGLKMIASGGLDAGSAAATKHHPTMLMYSAMSSRAFQQMKLQRRRAGCAACSSEATVTSASLTSGSLDYAAFCGLRQPVNLLPPEARLSVTEYAAEFDIVGRDQKQDVGLVDVREKVQFELAHMPGSINVPWSEMERWKSSEDVEGVLKQWLSPRADQGEDESHHLDLTFVCREGNDSQLAVQKVMHLTRGRDVRSKDIIGGWRAWKQQIDDGWPEL